MMIRIMLNTLLTTTIMLCSVQLIGQDQPPEKRHEKMQALKVAFITQKLDLTAAQAEKFWPVYNAFQEELKVLRKDMHLKPKPNIDEMSNDQIATMINDRMAAEQQQLDLRRKYHEQFLEILPIKQVAKLYRAEMSFRKEIIDRLRNGKSPKEK